MNQEQLRDLHDFLRTLAAEAGQLICRMRDSRALQVNYKGLRDPVTSADLESERLIIARIKEAFPEHRILCEETAPDPAALGRGLFDPLWIIDPIDGTVNYAHGHPFFSVSIAFADKGTVLAAAVDAPALGEIYSARKGAGACCNGEPIRIRPVERLTDALVGTGFPYERDNLDAVMERVRAVLRTCRDLRRSGSASVDACWVGCGRMDAFYEDLQPWDIAAGRLIACEAGARSGTTVEYTTLPPDIEGRGVFLAAPGIYDELREVLMRAAAQGSVKS